MEGSLAELRASVMAARLRHLEEEEVPEKVG
jgi:hypothetical protein